MEANDQYEKMSSILLIKDIEIILNKTLEEKTGASKEEQRQDNNGVEINQQEPHLSLAAQAYKLFSEG